MAARDRAAVRVEPLVLGIDAHPVAPRQHLHCEGLVQLEETDVVECEARLVEHALRCRDWADAHQLRLDARKRKRDESHLRCEAELPCRLLRGEERGRRTVRQAR